MKLNTPFWSKVLGYKVSVFFLIFTIVLWFISLRKQPERKPATSQYIEKRLASDSIKIQRLEYEKDSILFADSIYILQLRRMSVPEIEQEFHYQFSK